MGREVDDLPVGKVHALDSGLVGIASEQYVF